MNPPTRFLLLTCGFVLLAISPCRSQGIASISQIKEQIQRLEATDRDPSIPSKLRDVNHIHLQNLRAQLDNLLKNRIAALREYQATLQLSPDSKEKRVVENSLRDLATELKKLERDIKRGASWSHCPEPVK